VFSTLEDLLLYQSIITGTILLVFGIVLKRRGLFCWSTTGFWTWVAFALYFFANPLFSIWWPTGLYRIRLGVAGGLGTGEWIAFVAIVGILTFFIAYLRTSSGPVKWKLRPDDDRLTLPMKLLLFGFISFAFLALLRYRTGILSTSRSLIIEGGRFSGEITGYEFTAHNFVFVPVVFLLSSKSRIRQVVGWFIGGGFVVLRMLDIWNRFTIVSLILAMVTALLVRREQNRPSPLFLVIIIIFVGALQLRGHSRLSSSQEFIHLAKRIPEEIGASLSAVDTAMLPTWYLESYVRDTITGYDYGIPIINYALFGFIPGRIFPQKYFLIDWWRSEHPVYDPFILGLLEGAKSSLFGSLYGSGGILGVILGSWFVGFLCRKMDGMMNPENPILVKAVGITWLSTLWMIWGSSIPWGLNVIGALALPGIFLWIFSPKQRAVDIGSTTVPDQRRAFSPTGVFGNSSSNHHLSTMSRKFGKSANSRNLLSR
jgi:oligosaccharide repeat unit polymerase